MRRWAHRTHLVGLLTLAVAACAEKERPASKGGIAVTDDAGRQVTLAAPAQRIVSLLPSFTELLFAIGAGDRLVGRTAWCDYPPEALAVPSVGEGMPPNVEAVAARRPDLVVLYHSGQNVPGGGRFERLGIRTVLLDLNLLEDLGPAARRLGVLTARRPAADSLARVMDSVASQPPAPSTRSLAFIVWDNPPIVIGAGSYLDRLATLAGARNVFHDINSPSAQVAIQTNAPRGARVPRGGRARRLRRRAPGAGQEPARRPVPARLVGRRRARGGGGDRPQPPRAVGPAARGVRRGGGRDGAGVPARAHRRRGARPPGPPAGRRGRGRVRRGSHDRPRVARRSHGAAQRIPLALGRVLRRLVDHGAGLRRVRTAAPRRPRRGGAAARPARPRRGAGAVPRRGRANAEATRLPRRVALDRRRSRGCGRDRLCRVDRAAPVPPRVGPAPPHALPDRVPRGRDLARSGGHAGPHRGGPARAAGGHRDRPAGCPRVRLPAASMDRELILAVSGITCRYPGARRDILLDVSLEVRAGEFHAVLGPNGSGKTTLVRAALGLVQPIKGQANILGRPASAWGRRDLARVVGVLPQREDNLFPQRVRETVLLGRYPHLSLFGGVRVADRAAVERALVACDAADLADRWLC